jgi:hypothetical protein
MTTQVVETRIEIARRCSSGLDVTLVWARGEQRDGAVVCVRDEEAATYFEIPTETYLALDVYYHPFAYEDFSTGRHPRPAAARETTSGSDGGERIRPSRDSSRA